jgi:hypothetical protein
MRLRTALAGLTVVATISCIAARVVAEDAVDQSEKAVSFRKDIQPILNSRCVVCHVGGAENAQLRLNSSAARSNLVDVKSSETGLARVTPGHPESSYLINKLEGSQQSVGGSGAMMPLSEAPRPVPLDRSQIELFRRWITDGAPDN